jgi:hypothetical protein
MEMRPAEPCTQRPTRLRLEHRPVTSQGGATGTRTPDLLVANVSTGWRRYVRRRTTGCIRCMSNEKGEQHDGSPADVIRKSSRDQERSQRSCGIDGIDRGQGRGGELPQLGVNAVERRRRARGEQKKSQDREEPERNVSPASIRWPASFQPRSHLPRSEEALKGGAEAMAQRTAALALGALISL